VPESFDECDWWTQQLLLGYNIVRQDEEIKKDTALAKLMAQR